MPRCCSRDGFRYHPFYCEENAWWLCAESALGPGGRHVVFLTALAGRIPMLAQREAPPGQLVLWDYHVVTVDGSGRVWDFDSLLPLSVSGAEWLDTSFALADRLPPLYAPRLRAVPAAEYRQDFQSDRRHMRSPRGRWLRPPPPWPAIGVGDGSGSNLAAYLDPRAVGPGRLMGLREARVWLGDLAASSVLRKTSAS